ncbi:heme-copper oxidase subunit III [Demequina sp. SYSU T00192]|uniref:cytochrome-c oxidase n=2 Tax=Demequina litoralis TaxID=3051660 RepID=A0ABT8G633_9MICO|nr:heme-copper oxidase subunit III [Demequina sp. SYSU T00192]MDN4474599.1 heme-copper oxidase subunit III [Demequina sp. SYSU T00192]
MGPMSHATTAPSPIHATRPNQVAVGTIVWLSSELMFFAGLFAMYFTLRAQVPEVWADKTELLNIPFALANTTILVLSSFTAQAGVWAAERYQRRRTGKLYQFKGWGMHEWFVLTYIMGSVFIAGQVYEYAMLISEGLTISSSPYGSVFYLTTGFHGLHVLGGLIAMLFVLARSFAAKKFGTHEATTTIVVSYYWHFVDVVWIALFAVIYLIQ